MAITAVTAIQHETIAQEGNIKDPRLRERVEHALNHLEPPQNLEDTSSDELPRLTELWAQDSGIESLEGIERLDGISQLDIGGNTIVDLSPLEKLPNLTELNVSLSRDTNAEVLGHLPSLKTLRVDGSHFLDVDDLLPAQNLERLMINIGHIENLESIRKLDSLQELFVMNSEIPDPTVFGSFTGLRLLAVNNCGISILDGWGALTTLEHLSVDDNSIGDLTPLRDLENLSVLSVDGNPIQSIEPLASGRIFANGGLLSIQQDVPATTESGSVEVPSLYGWRFQRDLVRLSLRGVFILPMEIEDRWRLMTERALLFMTVLLGIVGVTILCVAVYRYVNTSNGKKANNS